MDKLIHNGGSASISNDGAEILKLLEIVHPAARVLVDIAKSQDNEVGDGTTSVTLLACEFLKKAKSFLEDGEHPQTIIRGFQRAAALALSHLDSIKISVAELDQHLMQTTSNQDERSVLEMVAQTALNSKLIATHKVFFAKMCVDAIQSLESEHDLDLKLVGIKKVTGGSVLDSQLVQGVSFKKTFSYAGFEQQPKLLENVKVLVLNVELELKSEKDIAEVQVSSAKDYQSIVDAEWQIIYDKLQECVDVGANVVLSKLPVGDLATQYFADRGVFCAGRVSEDDLERVCEATGAQVTTTCNDLKSNQHVLGKCGRFEEKQVGSERFNFFTECPLAKTATIILRGGSKQFVDEAHRSLHDALMVVKRTKQATFVVAGGGAIEMELNKHLLRECRKVKGKQQLIMESFAQALEVIPRQLCDNAGLDSTVVLNQLRKEHSSVANNEKPCFFGVDVNQKGICNTLKSLVWEPSVNKRSAIGAAAEAACLILSVDETVTNPQSEQQQMQQRGQTAGGQVTSQAMGGQGLKGMGRGMGVKTLKGRGGK